MPSRSLSPRPAAWLVAWNPQLYAWDDFSKDLALLAGQGYVDFSWNCGQNHSILPGDRVWLIRLGEPPKGIFGRGHALEAPHRAPSWRNPTRMQNYFPIRWTELLDAHERLIVLPQALLKSEPLLRRMHWSPRGSGVRIPDEVNEALEAAWRRFVTELDPD